MEAILSLTFYCCCFFTIALIVAVVPFCVYKKKKDKKIMFVVLCLCLVIVVTGLVRLAGHPLWVCPKRYEGYITEEEKQQVVSFNSGIYSKSIPFIPICIIVTSADKDEIIVETRYFPFGYTRMTINDDGPDLQRNIFGWE